MISEKNLVLSRLIKPNLSLSKLTAEDIAVLKIIDKATGGGVVPVYDADITNGIASFSGVTKSKPLVSLKLNIPVTQQGSGTPSSPSNIRDFIPFSGVNVSRTGKNLFDESIFAQYGGVLQTDGTWYIVNVATLLNVSVYEPPAGYTGQLTILLRRKNEAGKRSLRFRIYYTDGTYDFIGLENATGDLDIYTLVTNASKTVQSVTGDYGYNVPCYFNLMIAKGSIVTPYEPYTGNTYQITFGQTVYSANLDVLTGKLSITHGIVDLGDLDWKYTTATTRFYTDDITDISLDANFTDMFCSCYDVISSASSFSNMPDKSIKRGQSSAQISIRDFDYTDKDLFTASVTGQKLVYELAEPIEVQLTPTQITTLIGENVIFADVANVTECKYTRK